MSEECWLLGTALLFRSTCWVASRWGRPRPDQEVIILLRTLHLGWILMQNPLVLAEYDVGVLTGTFLDCAPFGFTPSNFEDGICKMNGENPLSHQSTDLIEYVFLISALVLPSFPISASVASQTCEVPHRGRRKHPVNLGYNFCSTRLSSSKQMLFSKG